MLTVYNIDPLNHFKCLRKALMELGAEASLDPMTFVLTVKRGPATRTLYPQFAQVSEARRSYTTDFSGSVNNFNGWYPMVNKFWELSGEKLKFKAFTSQRGFHTPAYTFDPAARPRDVIIKPSCSSFGEGIRGPFRDIDENRPETLLRDGEYYEQFIFGWIAKAWYWNDKPVCLKLLDMPVIKGDGKATVRELIERRREFIRIHYPDSWFEFQDWAFLDSLLAYQKVKSDDVLALGVQVFIDYRYNNCWLKMTWDQDNVLPISDVPGLREQLERIGSELWMQIPEGVRNNSIYTVDAILDNRDYLWLLEMNSNPQVHPDIYLPMLSDLFDQTPAASMSRNDSASVTVVAAA